MGKLARTLFIALLACTLLSLLNLCYHAQHSALTLVSPITSARQPHSKDKDEDNHFLGAEPWSEDGYCGRVPRNAGSVPKISQRKAAACSMATCLDLTRCDSANFRIYVYPPIGVVPDVEDLSLNRDTLEQDAGDGDDARWVERSIYIYHEYMRHLRQSKYAVSDPSQACLLFPDLQRFATRAPTFWHWGGDGNPVKRVVKRLPYWNNGINHVLWDQTDHDFSWWGPIGYAIILKTSWHKKYYRPGFDLTWPCPNAFLFHRTSRQRTDRPITSFFLGHRQNQHARNDLLAQSDALHVYQERMGRDHDAYAQALLETNFGVCPRGVGLATRRVLETLAAGAVPVILADEWLPPFNEIVEWAHFSVTIPEQHASTVNQRLDRYMSASPTELRSLQMNGYHAFNQHFHDVRQWIDTMLEAYRERIRRQECSFHSRNSSGRN